MSDARQQMIDAAVRVYGDDAEKTAAARQWLKELTEGADDAGLAVATERFEEVDRRRKSLLLRRIFLIASMVVAAASFYPLGLLNSTDKGSVGMFRASSSGSGMSELLLKNRSPKDRLLIGEPNESRLLQRQKLWESEPSNAAYFAEYAVIFHKEKKALPPGYFETAERLDPGNSWFDYFAACAVGGNSVKKAKRTEEEKESKEARRWEILDEAKYREALDIMARTRGKTHFNSYEEAMLRKRLLLLPRETPPERMASIAYLMESQTSYLTLLKLSEIHSARAFELEQAGDVEGFRRLLDDVHACTHRLSEDAAFNLVQELVVRAFISATTLHLEKRAERLGLLGDALWVTEWKEALEWHKKAKDAGNTGGKRLAGMVEREGTYLAQALPPMLRQTVNPPPLEPGDLKPGRLTEYALLSRACGTLLAIWLSLVAVTLFLYRFRTSSVVRLMARRAEQLLLPVDWLWIAGVGILLPASLIFAVMVFTPLGGWGGSVLGPEKGTTGMVRVLSNFAGLGLLLVIVPLLVTRWRLKVKGAPFGFRAPLAIGCLSVLCLVLATWGGGYIQPHWLMLSCASVAVIWLLAIAMRGVFSGRELLLQRVAVSRVMLAACSAGVLVMLATSFGFHAARLYWFERDELMKPSAVEPGLTAYEYRLTRQMRTELRQLIDQHR
ncbi:MAG: hypothetical protein EOP87_03950 [Verrucomicrobiaceae bacterium]|nr:MAG: hypothetical protein EOP87_03950 [Verrucomicrobiaceae bacterium]